MSARLALVLVTLLLVLVRVPEGARAGEPTDQLRARIDRLYRVAQAPGPASDREGEAEKVLDEMFDWPRMAEIGLRQHWQKRTEAEHAEFTRLFRRLFQRAYLSRINLVDAAGFRYLGDSITNDRAIVQTTIATKRGSPLDVVYALRLDEAGSWRVEDVRVERVSLMESYHAQFDAIIARSSYEGLVAKLREVAK